MSVQSLRLGIALMIATTFVFAVQDAFSRHLAGSYNVMTVVLFRYWFFAAFVLALSARRRGGLRAVARSSQPLLQVFRGVLLVAEICVMVAAFTRLGLVESHAVFAVYPLLVAALSGPVLGEAVGWRRRGAIAVGFVGVLIILRPGARVFAVEALLPLTAAAMFALYGLLTRKVAATDPASTSFFYTGIAGAAGITLVAPFWWEPMRTATDWGLMGALCLTGALGHWLLIKAYDVAEAGSIQPFAYFQMVFAIAMGVTIFGEALDPPTALGATIIVLAGIYTILRSARVRPPRD